MNDFKYQKLCQEIKQLEKKRKEKLTKGIYSPTFMVQEMTLKSGNIKIVQL